MEINQFDLWLADLNPKIGTESGKIRPVLIVQTNLLNKIPHSSTLICPLTSQVINDATILRVHLKKGIAQLEKDSDIMIDQLRAIDNLRLIEKLGTIPEKEAMLVKENIQIVLDLF